MPEFEHRNPDAEAQNENESLQSETTVFKKETPVSCRHGLRNTDSIPASYKESVVPPGSVFGLKKLLDVPILGPNPQCILHIHVRGDCGEELFSGAFAFTRRSPHAGQNLATG